jgi:hypothetical protein
MEQSQKTRSSSWALLPDTSRLTTSECSRQRVQASELATRLRLIRGDYTSSIGNTMKSEISWGEEYPIAELFSKYDYFKKGNQSFPTKSK